MINRFWPVMVWAILILALTALPGNFIPAISSPWSLLSFDKLIHATLFAVLVALVFRGLTLQYSQKTFRLKVIALVIFIGIIFGGLTEVMQSILNLGRFADIYDFIADSIGAVLGWPLFKIFKVK